jgi:hypothetical protein
MSLVPPRKVEKLQAALHTKAKEAPDYRFYALYDKLYRKDILQYAFDRCLANQGVAGVDGVTFEWIEGYGEERWLDELAEELRQQTYRTQPVRRVNIPKEGQPGKTRPLGIPMCRSYCTSLQRRWGLKEVSPITGPYFSDGTDFRVQVRRFGLRKPAMISDVSLIHQGA